MTHFSDGVRVGPAYFGPGVSNINLPGNREDLGVQVIDPTMALVPVLLGAPTAADQDGIHTSTAVQAIGANLDFNGALVANGAVTFDVPRAVRIGATGNESGVTFEVVGTDQYGQAVVENITGANAGVSNGLVAFKTVTRITVRGAATTAAGLAVGQTDVLGLPYRLASLGRIPARPTVDGAPNNGPLVIGNALDATVSATSGDVRGTFTPSTAPNGSREYSVLMVVDASTKESLYGIAPFAG